MQTSLILKYISLLNLAAAAPNNNTVNGETANTPAPLVVPPSQRWEGNDGPWSSFFLRVGSPVQTLTVLISTASNQPLVVLPEGCSSTDPSDCPTSRGGIFHTENSTTWKQNDLTKEGIFALAIETNRDYSINALYGNDTVALSYLGSGAPVLDQQLLGGIASKDLYMGVIGLNPASTNLTDYNNPIQSYMSTLKSQNKTPSLSYAYTAGNQYRFNKVLGSLTIGGYDASLLEPNDLVVEFNGDSDYDLTINVNSISMSSNNGTRNLSTSWFPAFIDSTLPYLYLPIEVCQQFEEAFGITFDNDTELYLVSDSLHEKLLSQAANITFSLTNITSQTIVDIVLPYSAFDLIADYPLVKNATRYFPLKRAENNTQTTLGRTFLQEAYLIADYERSSFSIYQRNWDANAKSDIQTILPPSTTISNEGGSPPKAKLTDATHTHPPVAIIIASVIGSIILLTVVVGCAIAIRQRSQKLRALMSQVAHLEQVETKRSPVQSYWDMVSPASTTRTELDAVETLQRSPELDATSMPKPTGFSRGMRAGERIYELAANDTTVSELIGSPVYEDSLSLRRREIEENRQRIRRFREQQQRRSEQPVIQDSP